MNTGMQHTQTIRVHFLLNTSRRSSSFCTSIVGVPQDTSLEEIAIRWVVACTSPSVDLITPVKSHFRKWFRPGRASKREYRVNFPQRRFSVPTWTPLQQVCRCTVPSGVHIADGPTPINSGSRLAGYCTRSAGEEP